MLCLLPDLTVYIHLLIKKRLIESETEETKIPLFFYINIIKKRGLNRPLKSV